MAALWLRIGISVVFVGILFQVFADVIQLAGPFRQIQPLSDFSSYQCHRIRDPAFESCEDMWLDDEARLLYAACSSTDGRGHWSPTGGNLDSSRRIVGGGWITVLSVDKPGENGLFGRRKAQIQGYTGAVGSELDLLGMDVSIEKDGTRRFWLVNRRPPVDANGHLLDATKMGDNATIDVFETPKGGIDLQYVKTVWNKNVWSPNKPAAVGDGSFLVTNDMSGKIGLRSKLDILLGGGNVAYCSAMNECHIAASSGFKLPNGMVRDKEGLFWIPNSMRDAIMVMSLDPQTKKLQHITTVRCYGMGIDNLSVDQHGDIFAAAIPSPLKFFASTEDPWNKHSPSTIFRIRKDADPSQYHCEKILEDRDAVAVSGASVAIHDIKTGRIFIGTGVAPYISVCEQV